MSTGGLGEKVNGLLENNLTGHPVWKHFVRSGVKFKFKSAEDCCASQSSSSSSDVSSPPPGPLSIVLLDRLDLEPSEVSSRKESMPSASDEADFSSSFFWIPFVHREWCRQTYRVTLVVEYLGWVKIDLGCSTLQHGY